MTESDLASTTKLVLFVIAEYASAVDDTCWPALETIAQKASLSDRAVSMHLEIAIRGGWLIRWKTRRRERRWAHCHYRLAWPDDVARRLRDDIELGLAAGERDDGVPGELPAGGSGDAQKAGNLPARGSGNAGELPARGSGDAQKAGSVPERSSGDANESNCERGDFESYLHDVPTNNPVVRVDETPSLSNSPPAVYQGVEGTGREEGRQEPGGEQLAQWMADRLLDSDPGATPPPLAEWAAEVDAMRAEDGRSAKHVACLWAWALSDGFWSSVVTHPAQLRKHWEKLRKRRNSSLRAPDVPASSGPVVDDRICSHVDEHGQRCTHMATSILGAGSARRGYCRLHVGIYE
ncbi:helix-turn-helix domain-containing protein [Burkholderia gladioli]|uniref:helix-turn-helix domain-containing protein n=1 Tax=Burkholderia gladioli TaxID=28095 RepID=UPI00163EACBB|nr:helix-turn-helix domain-containing protein [Burkholderia gladioli]